jgi:hypothetical protein
MVDGDGEEVSEMRAAIIITLHDYITKFGIPCVESVIEHTPEPRLIQVYDNESTHPAAQSLRGRWADVPGLEFIRVDDQKSGGGLTGTWNRGVRDAIAHGCDRVVFLNHDTVVDGTWAGFLKSVEDDNRVYGPTSNKPGSPAIHRVQYSEKGPLGNGFKSAPIVNGFCFGVTLGNLSAKWFSEGSKPCMFDPEKPFGGNETEFQRRFFRKLRGAHAVVVESTWVFHWKNHAWSKKQGRSYADEDWPTVKNFRGDKS